MRKITKGGKPVGKREQPLWNAASGPQEIRPSISR